jgi:ribosomal protein S18 acetylase RimI-like enzyme
LKPETAFDLNLPGYSVHRLLIEDLAAVQILCEKCLDFMLLVDGRPADPASVEEDFLSAPAGHSPADKFLFGIVNEQNDLVGYLDTLRGYPAEPTWWIGLLLLVPEARSQRLGQMVVEGFADYVRANGGQDIMLGVVAENKRAYQFWHRMGFEFVRQTEPQQFGNKTQTVSIMRRTPHVNPPH